MPPTFLNAALPMWLEAHLNIWVLIGLVGQSLFMMRFLYQWIASEKAKRSIVPEAFWYFSLGGGIILLVYALHQQDPVFILGQGLGIFIYLRNLRLSGLNKQKSASEQDPPLRNQSSRA
ncbi:MAG: lipid-A-disaccharide synthase N-terminal domain-containing protein [Bdellovibrionales bacterium]